MKIKTSIIIPNYNTKELLENCINSIIENTKYFEIIVVDNGSKDNSVEYLNVVSDKYEFLQVVFNSKNLGYSKANNLGAEKAKGKYLCFMNSDVVVGENWLNELYNTFSKDKNVGAVGPLGNPKKEQNINGVKVKYSQYKGQFKEDVSIKLLNGFCLLMSKKIFFEVGKWDEDFAIGNFEDTLLSCKIRLLAKKYLLISVKSNVKHLHPSSTFKKNNINISDTYYKNKEVFIKKLKQLNIYEKAKELL